MTCRDFANFLVDYLDDGLPADIRQRFDAHLEECPDCVQYLRQYRDTIRLASAAVGDELAPIPDELVRAIVLSAR